MTSPSTRPVTSLDPESPPLPPRSERRPSPIDSLLQILPPDKLSGGEISLLHQCCEIDRENRTVESGLTELVCNLFMGKPITEGSPLLEQLRITLLNAANAGNQKQTDVLIQTIQRCGLSFDFFIQPFIQILTQAVETQPPQKVKNLLNIFPGNTWLPQHLITPLLAAVVRGDSTIVRLLLDVRFTPPYWDSDNLKEARIAADAAGDPVIIELLRQATEHPVTTRVRHAADAAKRLVSRMRPPGDKDNPFNPLLHDRDSTSL